jgi:hypothetical protein
VVGLIARIRWLLVGDVDGAVRGDCHPGGVVELGGVAGAVSKTLGAGSGEGGDLPGGGVGGPDPMVEGVGDVDGAVGGDSHPVGPLNWAVVPGPSANPAVLPARVVTLPAGEATSWPSRWSGCPLNAW